MKKLAIVIVLLFPSLASAAWWNPLTWGKLEPKAEVKLYMQTPIVEATPIATTSIPMKKIAPAKVAPVVKSNYLTNEDKKKTTEWVTFVDKEIQSADEMIEVIKNSGKLDQIIELLSLVEVYKVSMEGVRGQILTLVKLDNRSLMPEVFAYAQRLHDDFEDELKNAIALGIQKDREARERALSHQRLLEEARIDQINVENKTRVDAQVSKYKEIMETAKKEGVTQGVVNGQLNAAGLMKTTNCYYSSVGGMTPGSGSMTCY